jgi:hypothetical protein
LKYVARPKYTAQIENIYFLQRIGATLRWATQDVEREELPEDIRRLLRRLDRLEAKARLKGNGDPEPEG